MIGTHAEHRIRWLTALGLGVVALTLVFWTPGAVSVGRMTQDAAVEYCRAEVTRGFLVKYQSTGQRAFKDCMESQGY